MLQMKLTSYEPEEARRHLQRLGKLTKPILLIAGTYKQFIEFCKRCDLKRGQALLARDPDDLLEFSYTDCMLVGEYWNNPIFSVHRLNEQIMPHQNGKTIIPHIVEL